MSLDPDTWTVVSPKPGRRSTQAGYAVLDFHQPAVPSPASSPASPADVNYIRTEQARITSRLRDQPWFCEVTTWVAKLAADHARVTQAVCLGTGSFGGPLDGGETIRRAHVQTAVFMAIVDILAKHCPISCVFQEPLFSDADRQFLQSLGHRVVEAPTAASIVTPDTLVFAIHLPTREYLACLTTVQPAMLVGTVFSAYEQLPQFLSESKELDNLRKVHKTFARLVFPREKHDYCFSDTCIYWRPLGLDF